MDQNQNSWNLIFRVTPNAKSWAVRYRVGGKRKLRTLGPFPGLSLKKARSKSLEYAALVSDGVDPVAANETTKREALSFGEIVAEYIEDYCKKHQRSWKQTDQIFKNHILPKLKDNTLVNLDRGDVIELLDDLEKQGLTTQVNRVLSQIKAVLSWAVENRGYLTANPIATLHSRKRRVPETSRDRILDGVEIKTLWEATDEISTPSNQLIKLLMLTGQRRDEVRCMRWSELDLKKNQWVIPADRNKAKRTHLVPLTPEVIKIIKSLPKFKKSDFVFTVTGEKPYSGMRRLKEILDRQTEIENWIVHDLRRTFRTGLSALSVEPEIRSRCVNHATGSKLDSVYDQYEYEDEKRVAMIAWEEYVMRVVSSNDNVVEFKGA